MAFDTIATTTQRGLTSEEMAIIERARALVRERDELHAVLAAVGFPHQGSEPLIETFRRAWAWCVETAHKAQEAQGKAETERGELRASVALLDTKGREMKSERDAALAQIERMKPVIEAALKWDEEGASDDELLQAAQDYRDAEEGAP